MSWTKMLECMLVLFSSFLNYKWDENEDNLIMRRIEKKIIEKSFIDEELRLFEL